jgi:arylsulfatase A-like enzyme
MRSAILTGVLLAILGCLSGGAARAATTAPDVVILVLDDVADSDVDAVSAPSAQNPVRGLPNIMGLAAQGLRCRRWYSHNWCAPTRDSLMYSRWLGDLHGAWACAAPEARSLDLSTYGMAHAFQGAGYHTAVFGKWHWGVDQDGSPWETAPAAMGFEHAAALWPIPATCQPVNQTNMSILIRDEFLSWWAATTGPRFALLSFEAAHAPWAYPPTSLLPPGYPIKPPGSPSLTPRMLYEAELVGADTAIGAILAVLDDGDVRIIMGDNGTPGVLADGSHAQDATRDDQDSAKVKLTCFEDGVRIPFIVAGPGIPAGVESFELGSVVDVFPTLRAFVGIAGPPLEGTAAPHDLVFCWGGSTLDSAVISPRWKLRTTNGGSEELYDLQSDPLENAPLPAVGPVAAFLRTRRIAILGH